MEESIFKIGATTYKKCQVIMLPASKSPLFLHKGGDLCLNTTGDREISSYTQPQHLYIISDEKIKGGDWFLIDERDWITANDGNPIWSLKKCAKVSNGWIFAEGEPHIGLNPDWSRKIIATTDSSLKYSPKQSCDGLTCDNCDCPNYSIPRPSNDFLKKYCEGFGKTKKILVKADGYGNIEVNSDNTISIRLIKDSWNNEEVEKLVRAAYYAGKTIGTSVTLNPDYYSLTDEGQDLEKWIEKNLFFHP